MVRHLGSAVSCLAIALGATTVGCAAPETVPPNWDDGPGANAWDDGDPSCSSDSDCMEGEWCSESVCQLRRCVDPPKPHYVPFGGNLHFGHEREVVAIDGASLRGYEAYSGNVRATWDLGKPGIVDVASGNLLGTRPYAVAVAYAGSTEVTINAVQGGKQVDVGFVPVAVAVGDLDANGADELVALADDGRFVVCNARQGTCAAHTIGAGVIGLDATVGDVDGDGYEEAVFLVSAGGQSKIHVFNADASLTDQKELMAWAFSDKSIKAISSGNLNADGLAEIVLLEDRGGGTNDRVHVFRWKNGSFRGSFEVAAHSVDVSVGDVNLDDEAEIQVLRDNSVVANYRYMYTNDLMRFEYVKEVHVPGGAAVTRIATFDVDDDSPNARLVEGPRLYEGAAVPIAVLTFPPYWATWSDGPPSVSLGKTQSSSKTLTETISVSSGHQIGVTASANGAIGIFTAAVSWSATKQFSSSEEVSESVTKTISFGKSYSASANVAKFGRDYASVVVGGACYYEFVYESEDPANLVGGQGHRIHVFLPIGGNTTLWSSKRYNAMASALGGLPTIPTPLPVGDASSYPSVPTTLEGKPIDGDDLLFPKLPELEVSDSGTVSWSLTVGKDETNAKSRSTTVGTSWTFGASVGLSFLGNGANVGANYGQSQSQTATRGYSITVGSSATFGGGLPPIPDVNDTPEDEYALHRYSAQPYVYRAHYEDASGETGGYYVVGYTAGAPSP